MNFYSFIYTLPSYTQSHCSLRDKIDLELAEMSRIMFTRAHYFRPRYFQLTACLPSDCCYFQSSQPQAPPPLKNWGDDPLLYPRDYATASPTSLCLSHHSIGDMRRVVSVLSSRRSQRCWSMLNVCALPNVLDITLFWRWTATFFYLSSKF